MNKIIMPPGGQTTDESLIVKWHKKVGDKIERGDVLFEIETDKATLEVESYCEGYLRAALYGEDEKVSTGEVVAYIGGLDEPLPEQQPTESEAKSESESSSPAAVDEEEDEYQPIMPGQQSAKAAPAAQAPAAASAPAARTASGRVAASPLAKKLARDNGLDLANISVDGVIKKQDVLDYLAGGAAAADVTYLPTSTMRKVIARRMDESVKTAPHYTVSMAIDMTACIALRKKLNEYLAGTVKISFNDILAKCVAKAIEKYPLINATYGEEQITVYRNVDVGLAVGIDNGLVVPVVRKVNEKTLSQIAAENSANVQKAKDGKLAGSDMGGTITISNLGMFGVDHFTAIINQPESCILAVGAIEEKAVSINHEIVSRDMMNITASFDHRLIDGAVGAQFLKEVKTLLEQPELLLV